MTYRINGTTLLLSPTTGRWVPRSSMDYDGDGRPVYPAVREFELRWEFQTPNDFRQLQQFYNTYRASGSVVAELPEYAGFSGTFYAYSGCILHEPEAAEYFDTYATQVLLVISNVRVYA